MAAGTDRFDRRAIAEITARMLLEAKAIQVSHDRPFLFTSGWASPIYVDCRRLISYPRMRRRLVDLAAAVVQREIGFEALDGVAGGETAGIPFAAWIADRLMLPMQYIRKRPQGFGRYAQIEGVLEDGARTLLVEDLTTDGRSKVTFCEALRAAGARVDHALVIFHYAVFPESARVMDRIGITLHSLATAWDVLRVARSRGTFDATTLDLMESYLQEPAPWSAAHGGIATAIT